jgi:hypothetical protein
LSTGSGIRPNSCRTCVLACSGSEPGKSRTEPSAPVALLAAAGPRNRTSSPAQPGRFPLAHALSATYRAILPCPAKIPRRRRDAAQSIAGEPALRERAARTFWADNMGQATSTDAEPARSGRLRVKPRPSENARLEAPFLHAVQVMPCGAKNELLPRVQYPSRPVGIVLVTVSDPPPELRASFRLPEHPGLVAVLTRTGEFNCAKRLNQKSALLRVAALKFASRGAGVRGSPKRR